MARKISMAAVEAALRSPKTPAGLKKGLMKKYGHLLGGSKVPMEALATTMRPNPKNQPSYPPQGPRPRALQRAPCPGANYRPQTTDAK